MHSSEMKGPPLAPCHEGECATEVLVVPEPMGGRRKPILRICEVPGGDFAPQKAPRARCYTDGQVSLHRARQALDDRRGLVCLLSSSFLVFAKSSTPPRKINNCGNSTKKAANFPTRSTPQTLAFLAASEVGRLPCPSLKLTTPRRSLTEKPQTAAAALSPLKSIHAQHH